MNEILIVGIILEFALIFWLMYVILRKAASERDSWLLLERSINECGVEIGELFLPVFSKIVGEFHKLIQKLENDKPGDEL